MSTLSLVATWGMLAFIAVMTRHSTLDYAAGVCAIVAMLPLAVATGETRSKRVTIPVEVRRRTR
jgi:hypothetical protein